MRTQVQPEVLYDKFVYVDRNMETVGIFEDTFDTFYMSIIVNHSVVGL